MKEINSLILSVLMAGLLFGCGGGGSSSTSTSVGTSRTSVPVTKGPLLEAVAKDKAGKTGTQITGTNKYEFNGEVSYPITVTGGYVDVNNNGIVDAGDYAFNGKLSSYSNVVTPITTYLGDTSKSGGKEKLAKLKELTGATDDDLLTKDPVDTNENVLTLVASIYQTYSALMDNDDTNDGITDDIEDDNSTLSNKFDEYKQVISSGTNNNETLEDKLVRIEEHLRDNSDVEELSEFDVSNIYFKKDDLIGKKMTISDVETLFFREKDIIYLDSSANNETKILKYENLALGIKLELETGVYYILKIADGGYLLEKYINSNLVYSRTLNSKLLDYSDNEWIDNSFKLTEDMISNKKFIEEDEDGISESIFYSDGRYSETLKDNSIGSVSSSCYGNWSLDSSEINKINLEIVCTDLDTQIHKFYLIFDELPVNGTSYVLGSSEFDIEESGKIDTVISLFTLTKNMISGKEITSSNNVDTNTMQFNENGTFISLSKKLFSNTGNTKCEGTWDLDSSDLNKLKIETNCSNFEIDNFYLSFSEKPDNGTSFMQLKEKNKSIFYISESKEILTPFTPLVVLNKSIISGKAIYVDNDNSNSFVMQFREDGSYISAINEVFTDGRIATCEGNWTLDSFDSRILNIQSECSDSKTNNFYLLFDEIPFDGIKFEIVEKGKSTFKSIYSFGNISSPIVPLFSFNLNMIEGKVLKVLDLDQMVTMKFGIFNGHGNFYKIIDDPFSDKTTYCYGEWSVMNSLKNTIEINSNCSNIAEYEFGIYSQSEYLTFKEEIKIGSKIGDYMIVNDILDMDSAIVSNKVFKLYDSTNDEYIEATFYSDGRYTEVGENYSYNGGWLAVNNTKIVIHTHTINGDSLKTDKVFYRVKLDFNSDNVSIGNSIVMTYNDKEYSFVIQDISAF